MAAQNFLMWGYLKVYFCIDEKLWKTIGKYPAFISRKYKK